MPGKSLEFPLARQLLKLKNVKVPIRALLQKIDDGLSFIVWDLVRQVGC